MLKRSQASRQNGKSSFCGFAKIIKNRNNYAFREFFTKYFKQNAEIFTDMLTTSVVIIIIVLVEDRDMR